MLAGLPCFYKGPGRILFCPSLASGESPRFSAHRHPHLQPVGPSCVFSALHFPLPVTDSSSSTFKGCCDDLSSLTSATSPSNFHLLPRILFALNCKYLHVLGFKTSYWEGPGAVCHTSCPDGQISSIECWLSFLETNLESLAIGTQWLEQRLIFCLKVDILVPWGFHCFICQRGQQHHAMGKPRGCYPRGL